MAEFARLHLSKELYNLKIMRTYFNIYYQLLNMAAKEDIKFRDFEGFKIWTQIYQMLLTLYQQHQLKQNEFFLICISVQYI